MITTSSKRLHQASDWNAEITSLTRHPEITAGLVAYLQTLSIEELGVLMNISRNLAQLNHQRLQDWNPTHSTQTAKPAILTYAGDIYQQFDASRFTAQQQNYAQKYLRISSGLYGLIRAYDLIQPYRLEMRLKLSYTQNKAMNRFWSTTATQVLNQDAAATQAEFVLNLASKEYAKVVDTNQLQIPLITAEFQEMKAGALKTIPLYSKQARGMLVGFCIENQVTDFEELKKFNTGGYRYSSQNEQRILFTRKH